MESGTTFRDLKTLDELAQVVELERLIWGPGYGEVVPVPILTVTVKRGGILIGAFDGDRMVGFVYSLPALRHGQPTQWSHMLGVIEAFRSSGLGYELKQLQRERALAMGIKLIEWTFDPMQAMNAHLNFSKIGVVAEEYEVNAYGNSTSPLHRGNPTDRLVAQWWIDVPRPRTIEPSSAFAINRLDSTGPWAKCVDLNLTCKEDRVSIDIPIGFGAMLALAPDLALAWRLATRDLFTAYLSSGYLVVDFTLDRSAGKGSYILSREAKPGDGRL
jgi:predicted GNAT superfamily acetyltransferase